MLLFQCFNFLVIDVSKSCVFETGKASSYQETKPYLILELLSSAWDMINVLLIPTLLLVFFIYNQRFFADHAEVEDSRAMYCLPRISLVILKGKKVWPYASRLNHAKKVNIERLLCILSSSAESLNHAL